MRTWLTRASILLACIAAIAIGLPLWRAYTKVATVRAIPVYVGRWTSPAAEVGTWSASNLNLTSGGRLSGTIEMTMAEHMQPDTQIIKDILFIQVVGAYASMDVELRPFGEFIPITATRTTSRGATFVLDTFVQVPTATLDTAPPTYVEVQLYWCRVPEQTPPNASASCYPSEVLANPETPDVFEIRFDQSPRSGGGKLNGGHSGAFNANEFMRWVQSNIPLSPAPTYLPVAYPAPTGTPAPYPAPTSPAYP